MKTGLPLVPRGYLWRRSRAKHRPLSAVGEGVVYWTFSVFGGRDRGGIREVLCMETQDADEAAGEVRHICRMIRWPPKGCAASRDAERRFQHSIVGAAAWHYRNKYLSSMERIGVEAGKELRERMKRGPGV